MNILLIEGLIIGMLLIATLVGIVARQCAVHHGLTFIPKPDTGQGAALFLRTLNHLVQLLPHMTLSELKQARTKLEDVLLDVKNEPKNRKNPPGWRINPNP